MEDIKEITDKLKVFSIIPDSGLSEIGNTKPKIDAIDKEFNETASHTYSENIDNIDSSQSVSVDKEGNPVTTEKKNNLGSVLKGKYAVNLMDMLLPSLMVLIIDYIGYSVNKKELQLTKEEKEAVIPAVQDVLDSISMDTQNPWTNLYIVLGIVYGSKFADIIPNIKKKGKGNKLAALPPAETVIENIPNMAAFEEGYKKLVNDLKANGIKNPKYYLGKNYPQKIEKLARENKIVDRDYINSLLNYERKKRNTTPQPDFNLD